MGRAIGDGVVCGFEVTLGTSTDPSATVLHVTAGLALDRKGDAVTLSTDVDVAITTSIQVQSATNGLFAVCQPPQGMIATNLDCYILTVGPASGLQGSAPGTGPSTCGFASTCGSANVVEGVQFNLLPLGISTSSNTTTLRSQALQLYSTLAPQFVTLAGLTGAAASTLQAQIAPSLSQFQNVVAHLCFGTDVLQGSAAKPFAAANGDSFYADYGVLGDLRGSGLPDQLCSTARTRLLDRGRSAVRGYVVGAPSRISQGCVGDMASIQWPAPHGRGHRDVFAVSGSDRKSALDLGHDRYHRERDRLFPLPAAHRTASGQRREVSTGFDYLQFFSNRTYRKPVYMEGAKLESLVKQSTLFPPIDLDNQEMLWLYEVRENQESIDNAGAGTTPPQSYFLFFANGQMPFRGEARFDLNYWNYANFA